MEKGKHKKGKDVTIFPLYMHKSIKYCLDKIVLNDIKNRNRNTIILECILYGLKHLYRIENIGQEEQKNDR